MAVEYRVILVTTIGNKPVAEVLFSSIDLQVQISQPGSAKISVSKEHYLQWALQGSVIDCARYSCYVFRGTTPIWGGILWEISSGSEQGTIDLYFEGFMSYLWQRELTSDYIRSNQDLFQIAEDLLGLAQGASNSNLGMEIIPNKGTAGRTSQALWYSSDQSTFGELWDQIAGGDDEFGFDWFEGFTLASQTVNRRVYLYAPYRRGKRGFPLNNATCSKIDWGISSKDQANYARYFGYTSGESQLIADHEDEAIAKAFGFPRLDASVTDTSLRSFQRAEALAVAHVRAHRFPLVQPTLTLSTAYADRLFDQTLNDAFQLGHMLPVDYHENFLQIGAWYRLIGYRVRIQQSGSEDVQLDMFNDTVETIVNTDEGVTRDDILTVKPVQYRLPAILRSSPVEPPPSGKALYDLDFASWNGVNTIVINMGDDPNNASVQGTADGDPMLYDTPHWWLSGKTWPSHDVTGSTASPTFGTDPFLWLCRAKPDMSGGQTVTLLTCEWHYLSVMPDGRLSITIENDSGTPFTAISPNPIWTNQNAPLDVRADVYIYSGGSAPYPSASTWPDTTLYPGVGAGLNVAWWSRLDGSSPWQSQGVTQRTDFTGDINWQLVMTTEYGGRSTGTNTKGPFYVGQVEWGDDAGGYQYQALNYFYVDRTLNTFTVTDLPESVAGDYTLGTTAFTAGGEIDMDIEFSDPPISSMVNRSGSLLHRGATRFTHPAPQVDPDDATFMISLTAPHTYPSDTKIWEWFDWAQVTGNYVGVRVWKMSNGNIQSQVTDGTTTVTTNVTTVDWDEVVDPLYIFLTIDSADIVLDCRQGVSVLSSTSSRGALTDAWTPTTQPSPSVVIGGNTPGYGSGFSFAGQLHRWRCWPRALTSSEITAEVAALT